MIDLSKNEARKIAVLSQRLAGPVNRSGVKRTALESINQIGYVQIDTISVVERAHHHKLWSRVDGYSPTILSGLEKRKQLFEYWSHAASYLPIDTYRYTLPVKQEISKLDKFWHQKDPKEMDRVLDRVKIEGPLMSREFEEKTEKPKSGWPVWGPSKRALHDLFMEGKLMVVGRKGFQKIYDLPERWLPNDIDVSIPSKNEYIEFLVNRDLRAHGLMKASEIGYLLKGIRGEVTTALKSQLREGKVVQARIRGNDEPYFMNSNALDLLEKKGYRKRLSILSPFDNLIINRKRTNELFDFDYTIECYVPQKKRKFGYFGLLLLWGNDIIGQLDLKADRKAKLLLVRNIEFTQNFKKHDHISKPFQEELSRFMAFNQCENFSIECRSNPHTLTLGLH